MAHLRVSMFAHSLPLPRGGWEGASLLPRGDDPLFVSPLPRGSHRLLTHLFCALLCLLAAAGLLPEKAAAQVPQPGPFQAAAGPYQISVEEWLSGLSLGRAQFLVTLREQATGRPVTDARVSLWFQSPRSSDRAQTLALSGPDTPGVYEARVNLDSPGLWHVALEVTSPLGVALVDLPPVPVPSARRFSDGSWVFIGVTLVLVAGAGYVYWSARRARRGIAGAAASPGSGQ